MGALPAAGHGHPPGGHSPRTDSLVAALDVTPWRIDHPLLKFVLFALVPALPAFRLHQLIAYGGLFGEYYTFGARAWLTALLIWWASWAVSLVLVAGALRAVVEAASLAMVILRPDSAPSVRRRLLGVARIAYFVGVPVWLVLRFTAG